MNNNYNLATPILRQGDCLELLKGIPDNYIDLIVTDPPYDITTTGGGGTVNKIKNSTNL